MQSFVLGGTVKGKTASKRLDVSNSPLGRPDRPIHILAGKIQEYVFFPSPDPLYVVLGTLAANMLKGVPVWIVLVGPPASGKTLLLDMLYINRQVRLPNLHTVDMIKGTGALLSGVNKKDKTKDATGGLLQQIGKKGILIIKDFTSMMSLPHEVLIETIGAFRRIYDGAWDRPVGSDGGKVLTWDGKIGMLTACTGVIDRHHQLLSELGERWMYYRYDASDGYGETKAVLDNTDPKASMLLLHELIKEFLDHVGVSWDVDGMERRELSSLESNRLFSLAAFAAASRSPVGRDWRTKEITDVPETEKPTRLAAALGQLYLGLEIIGLDDVERWRVVSRVALDSVPRLRSMIIKHAMNGGAYSVASLKDIIGCGNNTIRWAFEEMERHGVFEQVERGDRLGDKVGSWRLTQWSRKCLRLGWQGET